MKIYVASSWRNLMQPGVVQMLRSMGHEVYDFKNPEKGDNGFHWKEVDPNWKNWTPEEYKKALQHPIAQKGFHSDFMAMEWADVCVMVLPCGASAHTEAGFMRGQGKKVYVYVSGEVHPELMYKIYNDILISPDDLMDIFLKPIKEKQND